MENNSVDALLPESIVHFIGFDQLLDLLSSTPIIGIFPHLAGLSPQYSEKWTGQKLTLT